MAIITAQQYVMLVWYKQLKTINITSPKYHGKQNSDIHSAVMGDAEFTGHVGPGLGPKGGPRSQLWSIFLFIIINIFFTYMLSNKIAVK